MMHSAARTRTEAGVLWSSITLSRVVAAAVAPCWSLATAWEYAARLASRYAAWNSGSFCHRMSVGTETPTARAASSTFRCVSSAATAASILRPNFAPWPFT